VTLVFRRRTQIFLLTYLLTDLLSRGFMTVISQRMDSVDQYMVWSLHSSLSRISIASIWYDRIQNDSHGHIHHSLADIRRKFWYRSIIQAQVDQVVQLSKTVW